MSIINDFTMSTLQYEILQYYLKNRLRLVVSVYCVGDQWLTPVILATWEAKLRKISIQGQPEQVVLETLFPK
jgi:hypothetical protein